MNAVSWSASVTRLAVREPSASVDSPGMDVAGTTAPGLVMDLLRAGIPPSLLIDLANPEGMRAALTAEVAESEAALALAAGALATAVLPSRRVLGIA